jgi:hypothetical protein
MSALPFGGDATAYLRRAFIELPKAETVETIEALLTREYPLGSEGLSQARAGYRSFTPWMDRQISTAMAPPVPGFFIWVVVLKSTGQWLDCARKIR